MPRKLSPKKPRAKRQQPAIETRNDGHLIVRLPSAVLDDFRAYCAKAGVTMSAQIRRWIG